jgi:hypothetical protein
MCGCGGHFSGGMRVRVPPVCFGGGAWRARLGEATRGCLPCSTGLTWRGGMGIIWKQDNPGVACMTAYNPERIWHMDETRCRVLSSSGLRCH